MTISARIRDDLDVPVFVFNTETEAPSHFLVRQPDTDRYRLWEIAGTAHTGGIETMVNLMTQLARDGVGFETGGPSGAGLSLDSLQHPNVLSYAPAHKAATAHMQRWLTDGQPPPAQPWLEMDAGPPPTIRRDALGNARGGIRLPDLAVPVAAHSGVREGDVLAGLLGTSTPFSADELANLYASRDVYLKAYAEAVDTAVAAGVVVAGDADAMKAPRRSDRAGVARVASMATKPDETREGVPLTNLDQPLFDGADATKRDLIEYLDGVRDRIIPVLEDRPLSVIRVHRGQEAFMQKNVPKYTPEWVRTVDLWADASKREVSYALCNDRRTLLWFANQRAVEYHPALVRVDEPEHITHLVLDLDPPEGDSFAMAVRAAHLVRQALADAGLDRRGQDEWRQGRARLRPYRWISGLRGLGRGDACDRDARRTTRPRHRHNRIHEGRPRQQGLRRFDTCRRRNRDLGLQPARAARGSRVVPRRVGRSRFRRTERLQRAQRPRTARN